MFINNEITCYNYDKNSSYKRINMTTRVTIDTTLRQGQPGVDFTTQLPPPAGQVAIDVQELPPAGQVVVEIQELPPIVAKTYTVVGNIFREKTLDNGQRLRMSALLGNVIGICKMCLGNNTSLYTFDVTNRIAYFNNAAGVRCSILIDEIETTHPQLTAAFEEMRDFHEQTKPVVFQTPYTPVRGGMGSANGVSPCSRTEIGFANTTLQHNNFRTSAQRVVSQLPDLPTGAPQQLIDAQNNMAKRIALVESFHTRVLAELNTRSTNPANTPDQTQHWTRCRDQWAAIDAYALNAALAHLPDTENDPVQAANKACALANKVKQELQEIHIAHEKTNASFLKKTQYRMFKSSIPQLMPSDYAADVGGLVLASLDPRHARQAFGDYSASQKISLRKDGLETYLLRAVTRHIGNNNTFSTQFANWVGEQDPSIQADLNAIFTHTQAAVNAAALDAPVAGATTAQTKIDAARTALGLP